MNKSEALLHICESVEPRFISPGNVRSGSKYKTHPEGDIVEVVSSTKDEAGEYDVIIKFADGKTDKWYLSKNDKVFQPL